MATPFIRFPGVAGNNIWTPDLNKWDADTAHTLQSVGLWVAATQNSLMFVGQPAAASGQSMQCESTGTGEHGQSTSAFAVSGSTEYTFSVDVISRVDTAEYVLICQETSGKRTDSPRVILNDGETARLSVTVTMDPGTTTTVIRVFRSFFAGGDPVQVGDKFEFFNCAWRDGTESAFILSLDVVGSAFVSEIASVTPVTNTYTPGSPLVLGDGYAGDVRQWALHDGADAAALIVGQVLATDALRALPL